VRLKEQDPFDASTCFTGEWSMFKCPDLDTAAANLYFHFCDASITGFIASNGRMNDELEGIWKEVLLGLNDESFRNCCGKLK
jgi:hypothetical protein